MSQEFRIGIIGAGGIARNVHIPNYLKQKNVKIVAVADIVQDNVEKLAEQFDIEYGIKDSKEMLNSVKLDAVSVCTPNKFHAEASIAAMEAGCHFLCEQPVAMPVAESEQKMPLHDI